MYQRWIWCLSSNLKNNTGWANFEYKINLTNDYNNNSSDFFQMNTALSAEHRQLMNYTYMYILKFIR